MDPSLINFIKEFLANTLRLDFHYFTYPYSDISNLDRSLRASLTNSDKLYTQVDRFFHSMDDDIFYFITDNYIINYILFFPFKDKSDVISIGPYFTQHLNDEYWNKITEINQLTSSDIKSIQGFLYSIPRIENNIYLHSVISNIVSYANNRESSSFAVEYHDFSVQDDDLFIYTPKDDFQVYSDAISNRYHIENQLLEKIGNGNWEEALAEAKNFMSTPIGSRLNNSFRDQKSMVISANTLFRKSVEGQKIHPVYLHEISSKFVSLIENATSDKYLDQIYDQMIYEYCLLVQNKSRDMYSLPIRKIVDYIDLNLNYPLTLNHIANKFDLSAPYISSLFKKEVGTTLIKYINQLRIDNSLKLLQSSTMSIQDIAAYVGFYDNNYFTKLFKREMGITPTDYRKGTSEN